MAFLVNKNHKSHEEFWQDLIDGTFAKMVMKEVVKKKISSSRDVFNILRPTIEELPDQEVMYGFFLNMKHEILVLDKLALGTISGLTIYPREIIKLCIKYHAVALIIAHNHPSGKETPSKEDYKITKTLFYACNAVGISLLDHVVIGNTKYSSMADDNFITGWDNDAKTLFSEAYKDRDIALAA